MTDEENEQAEREEELIEVELSRSPDDVAAALRAIADDLEEGNQITIEVSDESATVDPPTGDLEYEVELEREPGNDGDEIELEIELEWVVPHESADGESDGDADDEAEPEE
ncbi:amphi-Trp domain-containing protein [Natrarchaeobaculum aegyptiacum]|uniref:Amphi-Trp domain-containing protein n=1 Tax=Natrarchaeobaculum aegyptiacum TaxID=745377 RepID=A0A2Z2I0Z5_9EURY|nr:amphi-Trp domain-containing protein [Natrarchaeobaculum aegyptiacum]ARS91344.1 amphi-Trp domain-containing protein [Natrarchaeobaculum aegyptiacum]